MKTISKVVAIFTVLIALIFSCSVFADSVPFFFNFSYKHVNEAGAENYLVESTGMKKYSEWQNPPITYWGPTQNGVEGRLVYRFDLPGPSKFLRLKASSALWDFYSEPGGSGRGAASLEASSDGIIWVSLRNSLEPRLWGADWSYNEILPINLTNTSTVWIRMRFYVEGSPNSSYTTAQTGRSTSNATENVFEFQASSADYSTNLQIVQGAFTWHDAKADAESRGGRLAVLDTQEKIDKANAFLNEMNHSSNCWIGLTDELSEGQWKWITGNDLSTSNWNSNTGEPNNGYGYGENYAMMAADWQWRWNDGQSVAGTDISYLLELPTPVLTTQPAVGGNINIARDFDSPTATLTAIPNPGYIFNGWAGDASGITNPLVLTMDANKTITAIFIQNLAIALDTTGLAWSSDGGSPWFSQNYNTYDGVDSARSGAIWHNQDSWMETTVTGPGEISYLWKVSSERNFDYLEFYINGVLQSSISGEVGWEQRSYPIASGSHTLRWRYQKDDTVTNGSDAAWVDQVVWTPSHATTLTIQPGVGGDINAVRVFYPPTATLTAIPNPGYIFSAWTGDASGMENPLTVTMDADKTVGATFSHDLRDTDGDGLTSYDEAIIYGTDPTKADTDGDGLSDGFEVTRYSVVLETLTWAQAKAHAEAAGGSLATFPNEITWNRARLAIGPDALLDINGLWIGATDSAEEGVWRWITGEPFDFTQWATGEPNDLNNSDYAAVAGDLGGEEGMWYDYRATTTRDGYGLAMGYGTDPLVADTDGDGLLDGEEHTHGTNPFSNDTDSDGLQDQVEVRQTGTNPLLADTDGDSVPDAAEDSDGDGLTNTDEVTRGTNPGAVDTDGDSLSDSVEVLKTLTDPLDPDSDDDGFSDFDSDPDGDGLSNSDEVTRGTNPISADTDGDGLADGVELNQTQTNPLLEDTDGDSLSDNEEDSDSDGLTNSEEVTRGTNPIVADTDADGMNDSTDVFPVDPAETIDTDRDGTGDNADADDDDDGLSDIDEINIYGTNPKLSDTDGDGLNDSVESNTGTYVSALNTGTDPNKSDTDADEVPDGLEVKEDTNPNNSAEFMGFSKGIQAYYALDGNANDLTGGGANGVARNLEWQANPVDSPGNTGAFLNPNSNLGGVLIQDHPSLHLPATGYTVCGWVQSPDFSVLPNTDHYMYLIESQTIVSQQESAFALGYDAHGLFFQCGSLDNYPDFDPGERLIRFGSTGESLPNLISSKQWHQIALVYDGNVFRGYLDGRELTPQGNNQLYLTAPKVSGRPTALGMRSDLVGQKNNGSIDEVRLYGRSLSGGEIKALYGSERPDFQIINGAFTWNEAKADAEARGGRLAVLDTQEKQTQAESILPNSNIDEYFIGAFEISEGSWNWIDGSAMIYGNWGNGEPNGYYELDVVALTTGGWGGIEFGQWNDTATNPSPLSRGYLLELPSTSTLNTELGVGGRIDVVRGFNSPTAVLTAIPNPGYIFTTWTGDASGTDNPLTITVDSDKTIGATFSTDLSDTDGDGLNNYQEVTRGTNPMMADTDGDGLNDAVETNTGIYVSPQDTGTNPNNPDTDGDLFGDGYEISTLKNPILVDSKPMSNLQISSVIDPEVYGDVTPAKEIQIENDTLAAWDSSGNGRIHLFDFKNGEIALRSSIDAPHTSYDWPAFGYAISMNGNRLLTGDHLTWLSGIHDGRAYQYDISNLATPVLQSTLGQDAQTATYIGAQVITVNGFSIISSGGSSGYGTENKVHIFREDGSFYRTMTEGYDQRIEFARSGSRDAFVVCRTSWGENVSRIRIYDISEGEIVERASSPPPISTTTTNPNEAETQFAYHRFAFDGTNILMVDVDFLRIFRPSNGQWIESSLDLRKYSGGSNFASTNILMTESSIFISSPKADCRDGNQGCVVIFDRVAGDAILRYRETLTRRSDSISGEFGSYVAYHEGSKHLVVSTEFGSTHAWDVVNTNQGKWAVYQTGNFKSIAVQTGANGRISGAGTYDIDSTVSLSAIPDPGYVFTTWTGDASGTDNPLTITIDSDKTVGASFSPDLSDTDGDGLNNYEEVTRGTNPIVADTDGDGLNDGVEGTAGTNALQPDTDSDGYFDGAEVEFGSAPLDSGNVPEWKTHIRPSSTPEPGVVIRFPTLPGKFYGVHASKDLIEWQELHRLTGTGGVMSHSEPRGSHTSRFFKVEARDVPPEFAYVAGGTLPGTSALSGQDVSAFYIAKTETTWSQWQSVRTYAAANGYDIGNAGAGSGPDYPVTDVSWYQVVKWCNARSEQEGLTPAYKVNGSVYKRGNSEPTIDAAANGYRLPTEAQWEFAARGGVNTQNYEYSGSNDVSAVAWYEANSGYATHAVATKQANELGLSDMSGNVWEWCYDRYPGYEGTGRVLRGGSWDGVAFLCRAAYRDSFTPSFTLNNVGFRVARSSVPQ